MSEKTWRRLESSGSKLPDTEFMKKKEMFFLPAELMKEARNEVLSLWMETEHEARDNLGYQFSRAWNDSVFVSCQTVQRLFPTLQPFASSKQKKKRKEERKKKCEFVWQQYIRFRKIFFIFSFSCCKIFVMVVMKVLLHCRVADKWHSVCEKKYACVTLYFKQFYARSHNFT